MTTEATYYLSVLPSAIIVLDRQALISFINPSAEGLLGLSAAHAKGRSIAELPGFDEALRMLISRVFSTGEQVKLLEHPIAFSHQPSLLVTLHITPLFEADKSGAVHQVMITIEKNGGLKRTAASAWKAESTRAAGVMAAMLAHEVKNPLSGIRGAAQLLRDEVTPEHQPLTDLICMETDRIRDLLNQVEVFSAGAPLETHSVNIHEVLQYVISVAQAGFARHVTFRELYDPSLPNVAGHRDLMVQLFLNIIKNAAEAMEKQDNATITLHTQYRSGMRMQRETSGEQVAVPITVSIEDNGPGIPADIRQHIFEPLISSKEQGRGLGLAVVAKLADDIGAMVELDESKASGTKFVVMMPVYGK